MPSGGRHIKWLNPLLQTESTGPLGTLQDEQTRLKAEYDRMEVSGSPLFSQASLVAQSMSWSGLPLLVAAHDINAYWLA